MSAANPSVIYLKDYKAPGYWAETIDLEFDLSPTETRVKARTLFRREAEAGAPLFLHGDGLQPLSVKVDGQALKDGDYECDDAGLTLSTLPADESFTVEIETLINPEANKALSGLYLSDGIFTTQCEPEGFRRITYAQDRPDVMARYTTRIEADKEAYPVLLSNGNCTGSGDLEGGRHWATWEDPFPKPTYLFALVAGKLASITDRFVTMSGREVKLQIFVEPGKEDRCDYAMDSLKRSMTWDEETFGLEYDLDIFMIVAVSTFNGGAMENKGLNIFNDKYILANPETATDADYANIEGVVAHEYFHNWTGNRITCRDWFQLCLKEGLTVFRDQLFSADMRSAAVKRVQDVGLLRRAQFAEDSGPLSHPVRPDHFIEIDNFFTRTVYEKGAELCRMIQTIVGVEGFKKGMTLYFERHDGEAATVENFVSAMADASDADLSSFMTWYEQSGTPEVSFEGKWDEGLSRFDLTLRQETRSTPDQKEKQALSIPVRLGLVGRSGELIEERVEIFDRSEQTIQFEGLSERPVPSLFRDFSAPVRVTTQHSEEDSVLLMGKDGDPFNRWDAGQQYALRTLRQMVEDIDRGDEALVPEAFIEATRSNLLDPQLDPAFKALALALPSETEIGQDVAELKPQAVHKARKRLSNRIGVALKSELLEARDRTRSNEAYSPDAASAGRRALGNQALVMLAATGDSDVLEQVLHQNETASNMTDRLAALNILTHLDIPERDKALDEFYETWKHDPIMVTKWLALQAMSSRDDTLERVVGLLGHPAFKIDVPNLVYALPGAFGWNNQLQFHDVDGAAYKMIADQVLKLDTINPEIASDLCTSFSNWRKLGPKGQELAERELRRIEGQGKLSPNLFEIVTKILG